MPISEETSTTIACDNPKCPGIPAGLSADDRHGWIIASTEKYGEPVESHVFCSYRCAGEAALARGDSETATTVTP